MGGMNGPSQIAQNYVNVGVGKTRYGLIKTFALAIMAGAFISFGALGSTIGSVGLQPAGLSRIVSSLVFPIGLVLVLNGLSHLAAAWANRDDRLIVTLLGAPAILLGVFIILQPGFIVNVFMIFIGAALVFNGLMDLLIVRRIRGALL